MAHDTTDPETTAQQLARQAQQRAIRARRQRQQRLARQAHAAPASSSLSLHSPTQRQGHRAESRALAYLQEAGVTLLARNLRCQAGEIDLVCLDGATLVFIEVRERRNTRFGGAAASIGHSKQQRLMRAAAYWLPRLRQRCFAGRLPACRFDAVVLNGQTTEWIRNAFAMDDTS